VIFNFDHYQFTSKFDIKMMSLGSYSLYKKSYTQYSVYSVDGKRVRYRPHVGMTLTGRVTLCEDQIGHFVVHNKVETVLKMHCILYVSRYEDPVVHSELIEKWNSKHAACEVCLMNRRAVKSLREVPSDLCLDRLFGDLWKDSFAALCPERTRVVSNLHFSRLLDYSHHLDFTKPLEVELHVEQLQNALREVTGSLMGETSLWAYHRRVLTGYMATHDKEIEKMIVLLKESSSKTSYYHRRSMEIFEKYQYLKERISALQVCYEKATIRYKIQDPDLAFVLCPRPIDCDGMGVEGACCVEESMRKKMLSMDQGCVICPYPACITCYDFRHRC
jgi:hypothetical protein